MSLRKNVTSFRVGEVYTVLRLRRLLQMVAAIGWLQRNSSRSKEGRVSWPGRRRKSSRSSEGGALGPRSGWLQRYGFAVAFRGWRGRLSFPADAGCTTRSRCFLACQTPRTMARCRCQAATEHRIDFAHLVLHPIWNDELSSEKEKTKRTQTPSTI